MHASPEPTTTRAPRERTLTIGVGVAIATAAAFWDSSFHAVPSAGEGLWRGVADPPGTLRLVVSVLFGGVAATLLARLPVPVRKPFLAFGLAIAPLIPVLTGRLLPLLLFQGPILRLLTGAVLTVAAARLMAGTGVAIGRVPSLLLFTAAFIFYAAWGERVPGPAGPQGDEPHYLVLTQSLLSDGDLDLTDEFEDREYARFYGGTLAPHASPNTPPGRLYSMHSPGLPALLLPAYALGGYPGARLFMSALAAFTGVLLYRLVIETFGQERLAAAAWALVTFTPPLPFYAVTLYPETLAALATVAFLLIARRPPSAAAIAAAALLAGLLPWVHTKLIPLGALGLAFTLIRPCAWRVRIVAAGAFLASLGLLLSYFHAFYGQASFLAALGPPDVSLRRLIWGAAGLFLDRQYGLLTVAPVLALAVPGAVVLLRNRAGDALRALLLALLPVIPAAAYIGWWGGASPPARYVLPVLGPLILLAVPRLVAARDLVAALGGIGFTLLGLAADVPRILRNRPDGESLLLRSLSAAVDLNGWLPSFVEEGPSAAPLALSLAGVAILAWRWRWRGLLLGLGAHALAIAAVGERSLIDRRLATERLLWEWEAESWAGPAGNPGLRGLRIPLELPRSPWILDAGQVRTSRRLLLPPGAYRIHMRLRPLASPAQVRIDFHAGALRLAQTELASDRTMAVLPLLLPAGARGLGLTATGIAGQAGIEDVLLAPEALVPRSRRGEFPWPEVPGPENYRVGQDPLRVTVLDRSAPEAGGFRLEGKEGSFLVEAPAGATVEVQIKGGASDASDAILWGSRRVAVGGPEESPLRLPMGEGVDLGPAAVVPVRVHAPGAWVSFSLYAGQGPQARRTP